MDVVEEPAPLLGPSREFRVHGAKTRLRHEVEQHFQPHFFGEHSDRFGYWFGLDEPRPRGQFNAILAMADAAPPGAWSRVFHQPQTHVHHQPTLRGVDFPRIAIRRAHNDMTARTLEVTTAVTTPDPAVELDHRPHPRWRVTARDAIDIDLPTASCELRVRF